MRRALLGLVLAAGLLLGTPPARAQDGGGQVPTQDIIPQPNSGHAPEDAGDRGGALQLLLLAGVVLAVTGGGWHLARQARRGRARMEQR